MAYLQAFDEEVNKLDYKTVVKYFRVIREIRELLEKESYGN